MLFDVASASYNGVRSIDTLPAILATMPTKSSCKINRSFLTDTLGQRQQPAVCHSHVGGDYCSSLSLTALSYQQLNVAQIWLRTGGLKFSIFSLELIISDIYFGRSRMAKPTLFFATRSTRTACHAAW